MTDMCNLRAFEEVMMLSKTHNIPKDLCERIDDIANNRRWTMRCKDGRLHFPKRPRYYRDTATMFGTRNQGIHKFTLHPGARLRRRD